ncbi:lysostaphin resistance A-like protein [Chloroflexota bacterium]
MNQMELAPQISQPEEEIRPGTWWDFFLYLFGGFGLYVLVSRGFSLIIQEINFALKVVVILVNVGIIGGSAYVFGIRRKKISWRQMGMFPSRLTLPLALGAVLLTFVLLPVRGVVGMVVQALVEGGWESLEARQSLISAGGLTWYSFLVTLVGVGFLAPVAEEMYFRGLFYNWFRQRLNVFWSVLISSTFFALGHIDSAGVLASAWVMGLALALVYEQTKTMWAPILMHIVTNTFAVLLTFLLSYLFQLYEVF